MPRQRSVRSRASEIERRLREVYPGSAYDLCELVHKNAFELLAATILSAQCTDVRVNAVTPALFARYPDAAALAGADVTELEEIIRTTGFFRSKAQNLIAMARGVLDRFGGEVPSDRDALVSLAGVGRKTANVVRSVAFGEPGLPVDTHVLRLSRLLGLTAETDPVKVEQDLCGLFDAEDWGMVSLQLILHGRRVCIARRPKCAECELADLCPSAFGAAIAPVKARAKKSASME